MKLPNGEHKKEWHVIGRGTAGWYAKGINVSSSGGDIIDRPWWAGGIQYGYPHGAIDGCLVYDASEADEAAFRNLVIAGPMCNPKLDPDAVERFHAKYGETAARMAPFMAGSFQALATVAAAEPEFSGLDYVGVNVYRRLLAEVPGVKFGRVINGVIEWDRAAS